MGEIIVADEITKLEQVVNYLKNLLERFKNYELVEEEVLSKIDENDEVRKHFIIEFMEIVRDELRYDRLTDFMDGYGAFGVKYSLEDILERVVWGLEYKLEKLMGDLK